MRYKAPRPPWKIPALSFHSSLEQWKILKGLFYCQELGRGQLSPLVFDPVDFFVFNFVLQPLSLSCALWVRCFFHPAMLMLSSIPGHPSKALMAPQGAMTPQRPRLVWSRLWRLDQSFHYSQQVQRGPCRCLQASVSEVRSAGCGCNRSSGLMITLS